MRAPMGTSSRPPNTTTDPWLPTTKQNKKKKKKKLESDTQCNVNHFVFLSFMTQPQHRLLDSHTVDINAIQRLFITHIPSRRLVGFLKNDGVATWNHLGHLDRINDPKCGCLFSCLFILCFLQCWRENVRVWERGERSRKWRNRSQSELRPIVKLFLMGIRPRGDELLLSRLSSAELMRTRYGWEMVAITYTKRR